MLVQPRVDVSLKVTASLGEASMHEAVYGPILDALADHKPRTVGQIEQVVKDKGVMLAQITQAMLVLVGAGTLASVQDESLIPKVRKQTEKLNIHLIGKARGCNDIGYLASPVTGGGFTVNRFQQLFLLAITHGKKQPAEWAQFVWQIIAAQGQRLIQEGKTLDTAEENISELTNQATTFAEKQLPILKALQIA